MTLKRQLHDRVNAICKPSMVVTNITSLALLCHCKNFKFALCAVVVMCFGLEDIAKSKLLLLLLFET